VSFKICQPIFTKKYLVIYFSLCYNEKIKGGEFLCNFIQKLFQSKKLLICLVSVSLPFVAESKTVNYLPSWIQKKSALMDSKKQGYRITEDSVKSFAEKQNLNVGSIWKKDILKFIPVIGGVIAGMDMLNDLKYAQDNTFDNKYQDINDLDVLNAIVERKQAGIDAYNLQIEYQNFKLAQAKLNQIK